MKVRVVKDESAGTPTLHGDDPNKATVEAEKGETVLTTSGNVGNQKELASIAGRTHEEGGTFLDLPPGSAIFSDHLKLKDEKMLNLFGYKSKKPRTFAEISKQYKISELNDKLADPDINVDKITKTSLEKSLENANFKLSLLFTLQQFHEEKKGEQTEHSRHFEPLLDRTRLSYDELLNSSNLTDSPTEKTEDKPMKDGGLYPEGGLVKTVDFEEIPKFDNGGEPPPHLYEETDIRTTKGATTPTGKKNTFKAFGTDFDTYSNIWNEIAGIDLNSLGSEAAQRAAYDWALINNPESIRNMWLAYGLTEKGMRNPKLKKLTSNSKGQFTRAALQDPEVLKALEEAYVDGFYGVRQLDPKAAKIPDDYEIERKDTFDKTPDKYKDWNVRHLPNEGPAPVDMRYRWENRRALAQAKKNRRNIPFITPFTALPETYFTDSVYYNPDQAIAAMQSMASTRGEQQAMFASPQTQLANQLAGQEYAKMNSIISEYADKNVAAYNQERNINTNIAQQSASRLAAAMQSNADKWAVLKQQYSNAITNADNAVAMQEIAMHKERADRLNSEAAIGEQFRTDPNTGIQMFVKGKDFFPDTTNTADVADTFQTLRTELPNASDDVVAKLALAMHSDKYKVSGTANEYNPDNYSI